MKKKNVEYQYPEKEESSLQEPVVSYQQEDLYRNAKVAIEVDRNLFEQLKMYAQSTGHTISDIVEKRLRGFLNTKVKDASKPVSSKLRGIVELPADFDYKEEIFNKSAEK